MSRESAGVGAPQPSPSSTSSSSRFAVAAAGGLTSTDSTIAAASKSKTQSQTQSTLADSLRALRGNSSRESLHGAASVGGSRRKAAPSPLQHSTNEQNTSGYSSSVSSPRLPVSPLQSPLASPRLPDEQGHPTPSTDMPARQSSTASTAAPSTRDKAKSGQATASDAYGQGNRKSSAPAIGSAQLSPPQTPTAMAPPAAKVSQAESRPTAVRNVSRESATSSISSEPQSSRSTPSNLQRSPQDPASSSVGRSNSRREKVEHKDLASYVASMSSPQAALEALWKEKQSSSQHTAQLWRLVEKQREMILGLNKDLERAGKDKERYRKKLKEHLAQKPLLPNGVQRNDSALSRVHSQSPAPSDQYDPAGRESAASEQRSMTLLRSDSNLSGTTGASESPTDVKPAEAGSLPSSSPSFRDRGSTTSIETARTLSVRHRNDIKHVQHTPSASAAAAYNANSPDHLNTQDLHPSPQHINPHSNSQAPTVSLTQPTPIIGNNAFASPASDKVSTPGFHRQTASTESAGSAPALSPTSNRKKAPPAPLNLSKPHATSAHLHQQQPGERSDSEYDDILDDGEEVPPIMRGRGRRKTREEDDALREAIAKSEERSKSTKKKSKSKSKPGSEGAISQQAIPQVVEPQPQQARTPAAAPPVPGLGFVGLPASPRLPPPEAAGSINALLSPTSSDSSGRGPGRGTTQGFQGTPPMMTPGLPLSPRPMQANAGPQPMGLPMSPRAGKTTFAAAPLSPRPGVGVGMASAMPLSPRAPRSAIPLPPTSPLGVHNPHLQRAEQHAQGSDSLAARMAAGGPEGDRSNARSQEPGPSEGICHGLEDDRYPGLLLPPNALPSIDAKVFSSRMRPSRNSILFAKPDEDPVFQLGVYARSSGKQLWRVEKTTSALAQLHDVVTANTDFMGVLPDRSLFQGHAPAKIDARRTALDEYFDVLLDTEMHERTALEVCSFFSENAIEPEPEDAVGSTQVTRQAPPQLLQQQPQQQQVQRQTAATEAGGQPRKKFRKEGYLTKRGKNFGGWKARYFVLDGSALTYFDAPGGQEIGRIKLANAQIGKQQNSNSRSPSADAEGDAEDNEYRHAFLVLEPKRKDEKALVRHVLCAESDAERDAWVAALLLYVEPRDGRATQQSQAPVLPHDRPAGTRGRNATADSDRSAMHPRSTTNDTLPPGSSGQDSTSTPSPELDRPELVKGYSYDNMPQQQEPQRGLNRSGLPSPPIEAAFLVHDHKQGAGGKSISGPSGAMKIHDASLWGNKVAPPPPSSALMSPSAKDHKKRSIFGFRGRAPSDLAPGEKPSVGPAARLQPHPGAGHAVFGVPLAEAVDFTKPFESEEPLPSVVYRCIEYLRENDAVEEEGIFRLSGSNVTIKALKDRFNTEGDVRLLEGEYYDINAVASLLKAYLRELPVSVLTREHHLDFLNVLKQDDVDKVKAFNVLVHRLPPENRALVSILSQFLIEIVDNQDRNKMNVRNIAIVFGPTLNIPGPIITAFLTDYDAIFGDRLEEEQASPIRETLVQATKQGSEWDGIRSPRHQMFSDLPTPAYNQTGFQSMGGFAPMQQGPAGRHPQQQQQQRAMAHQQQQHQQQQQQQQQQQYMTQVQPSQDGYGSLNAALGPPQQQQQQPQQRLQVDERQLRKAKRESNIHMLGNGMQQGGGGGGLAGLLQQQRKTSYQSLSDGSRDGQSRSPARQF